MILKYYNNEIYLKESIDIKGIEKGSAFDNSLSNLYNTLPIANDPNQNGEAKTTVNLDSKILLQVVQIEKLIQSVCFNISEALFILEGYTGQFHIDRFWTNRMYENTCGSTHIHNSKCHYVAMYYYEAPANCSMFIINGHNRQNEYDYDFSKNDKLGIQVQSGTFILHPVSVNHSVGRNATTEQRTVFVFEVSKT